MKKLLLLFLLAAGMSGSAFAQTKHTFVARDGQFLLDGKPFQIISGEMHYARIPRAAWRERFRMAKAMGLNTITTYIFWNLHEPKPGTYDFSGNNDVAEFIREAQQEGLYVILRPGPYVCAEWDFGGYPAWLLKPDGMVIRSTDPKYLALSARWLKRLGQELDPLLLVHGGPILAVQIENEYGDFGNDHAYMQAMHQQFVAAGFDKALLYTGDPAPHIPNGSLPDVLAAANFGPGHAREAMALLQKLRPNGPYMVGEYWDGWFDHWGEKHSVTNGQQQADEIEWILKQGYSLSIYMFHGGTSFGWMNGANSKDEKDYRPDVTSYDYDAVLSESGQPTPKYSLFRDAIARATGKTPPAVPAAPVAMTMPRVKLTESIPLWKTLPHPVHAVHPLSMEQVNQSYGYILYRTTITGPTEGVLRFDAIHDYAQVYLDGKLAGTIDRRLGPAAELTLHRSAKTQQLDVLVENTGRINFSVRLRGERKGIVGDAMFAGKVLRNWSIYPLPMTSPEKLDFNSAACAGACFYKASFNVAVPKDTFLDTRELHKGEVWVNGVALGRFWDIGPQKALYLPESWLHKGGNEVVIFDLDAAPGRGVQGLDHPLLGPPMNRKSE